MRLVRFRYNDLEEVGIVLKNEVVPVSRVINKGVIDLTYPFVSEDILSEILSINNLNKYRGIGLKNVELLSPVKFPGKIICLGLNYWSHIIEGGFKKPKDILIFFKPRTSLAGPYETIEIPRYVGYVDYEGELAVIIGKRCKNVSEDKADDCILGYTIMNDVSARSLQFGDKQWSRGKGIDKFAPLGPWIVTKDEIRDPHNLCIRTWLNNELRQDSSTLEMIFKIPSIISKISMYMTLEIGDVIATGTPAGVGFYMGKDKMIRNGDIVTIEVSNIGYIKNKFVYV